MEIEVVSERIPGSAPVSAHSRFASLASAADTDASKAPRLEPLRNRSEVRRVDLGGEWRRKHFDSDPDEPPIGSRVDDRHWNRVSVPDNFGLEPALSMHFGPVYYRRRLAPLDAAFSLLVFSGVDYLADVWLDDQHLGRHEGYFAPFCFDVTGKVERGSVLTVRVQDPLESLSEEAPFFEKAKRYIKGTLNYHDSRPGGLPGHARGWTPQLGQSISTGGIPQPVGIEATGAARFDGLFATPLDVEAGVVQLSLVITNLAAAPMDARVGIRVTSAADSEETSLAIRLLPGSNRVDARIAIADPKLWWPVSHRDLGDSELYVLEAAIALGDVVSDHRSIRFGLRTARVRTDDEGRARHLELNGRPIMIKAANYIPRQHFAGADVEFYRRDMRLAAAAHLNSLGVHAHLQPPACYHAADEEGLLIFQDFPLQWHYDSGTATNPDFVEKACQQIADMAYTFWNHPSIVYWACHNEPASVFRSEQERDPAADPDNQVLDEALEARLRSVETTRHVHRASGIGDDLHVYDGSVSGGDVYGVRRRKAWFVSEFGFWTIGAQAERWGDAGWPPDDFHLREWESRLSFADATMSYAGLPSRYGSLGAWRRATETYGAFLAKYQTEWFRIHRGAPFWGYRWHFFVDWWGWAGAGLLDVDRRPKATYRALADASRPVLVATSLPGTVFPPETPLVVPLYAVNDTREELQLELVWRLRERGSLVIGVDEECPSRRPVTPGAMVAVPYGQAGEVLAEGAVAAASPSVSAVHLTNVSVTLPERPLLGTTLELEWAGESNWYHLVTAPEGWFCGPGAFTVEDGVLRRLGDHS